MGPDFDSLQHAKLQTQSQCVLLWSHSIISLLDSVGAYKNPSDPLSYPAPGQPGPWGHLTDAIT